MAAPNGSAIPCFPEQIVAQAQSDSAVRSLPAPWDGHGMAQPQLRVGGHQGPRRTCCPWQQCQNNLVHQGAGGAGVPLQAWGCRWALACPIPSRKGVSHRASLTSPSSRRQTLTHWELAELCQAAPPAWAGRGGFHTAHHCGPNSLPSSGSSSACSFKAWPSICFYLILIAVPCSAVQCTSHLPAELGQKQATRPVLARNALPGSPGSHFGLDHINLAFCDYPQSKGVVGKGQVWVQEGEVCPRACARVRRALRLCSPPPGCLQGLNQLFPISHLTSQIQTKS